MPAVCNIIPWILIFLLAQPAAVAATTAVDLELALGVDVSGSVDEVEARLQRDGYVAALNNQSVIRAIRSGILQRIAVMYFEWAGDETQSVVVGWTLVSDRASARRLAARISKAPITRGRYTSISSAMDFARPLFAANRFQGTRRVLDISGDGSNNAGDYVNRSRDETVAAGITVNGLPIVNQRLNRFGMPMPGLDLYYRDCVIGGPGAFLVMAQDFQSFARAIRRKLILEIAGLRPSPLRYAGGRVSRRLQGRFRPVANRLAPPCDVGERRLHQRLRDNF